VLSAYLQEVDSQEHAPTSKLQNWMRLILKFPIQIAILGIPKHGNDCFPLTSLDHGVVMKSQKVAGNGKCGAFLLFGDRMS